MLGRRHSVHGESLESGASLQVQGHDHGVLVQVKCDSVAWPPSHYFYNVEKSPMQEVLQGAACADPMTLEWIEADG